MLLVRRNELHFQGKIYRCAIGKSGFSEAKKEGDGATPLGVFALCECWYRADKVAMPQTDLPLQIIEEHDGWCDDATSPDYNRHILLPYELSHERLWRGDDVYDVIVPLGYNDDPIVPGHGSAIFMHVAKPGYSPTEGCVALALPDLLEILAHASLETRIEIRKS
jgi:L,D-peptidoglycan transpeptidase YkuD (ErfK/YbiS/YcfS/YnhG family)